MPIYNRVVAMAPVRNYGMRGDAPSGKYLPQPTQGMMLGDNPGGTEDWTVDFPFYDVMKQTSAWFIWDVGASGSYSIDLQDRVLSLTGTYLLAKKISENAASDTMPPGGTYTVRWTGSANGRVRMSNGGAALSAWTAPGEFTFTHTAGQNLYLQFQSSDGLAASMSDCSILLPGFVEGQKFRQEWLDFKASMNFGLLRFMLWTMTNGNYLTHWEDRTTPDSLGFMRYRGYSNPLLDYNGAYQGQIPYEWACDLCNQFNADMYVTIPTRATDDYAYKMGELIRQHLKAGLLVYVEHTNETWNSVFTETHQWIGTLDATKRTATGTAGSPTLTTTAHGLSNGNTIVLLTHEHGDGNLDVTTMTFGSAVAVSNVTANTFDLPFNVDSRHQIVYWFPTSESSANITFARKNHNSGWRSVDLWDAFKSGFKDDSRIIEVIGAQGDNVSVGTQKVSASGSNGRFDVVATSQYFTGQFTYTYGDSIAQMVEKDEAAMAAFLVSTDAHVSAGLTPLIAYEGGPHWVAATTPSGTLEQRSAAIQAYEVNPEMGTNINRWLRHTANRDFISFFYFIAGVGPFSQWGQWMVQTAYENAPEPKYQALLDFQGYVPKGEVEARLSRLYMLTFSEANGSPAPDVLVNGYMRGTWEQRGGKLRGINPQAAEGTAYNRSWLVGVDAGMTTGEMHMVINANGEFGDEAGFLLRGIDAFNFLDIINLNGVINAFSIVAGGVGPLLPGGVGYTIPSYSNTADYLLSVYIWGNTFSCYVNGVFAFTFTTSTHSTGTIFGIKSSNGLNQTYDNMMFPHSYVSPVTTATICGFWHSMFSHTNGTPPNAPASTYTDAGNWLTHMDTASGVTCLIPYGRFGNAEMIDDLWVSDNIGNAFVSNTFSHYTLMAPNFVQNWANDPFPNQSPSDWAAHFDSVVTRVLATGQNPEMLIIEAAGYSRHVTGAYPVDDTNLTNAEFGRWREFMRTTATDWYQDMVIALGGLRPNVKFRMVPVCNIFCDLVEEPFMSTAVWTDFFGDPSPHGTESYYFITALITHRAIFGTDAVMTGYTLPVGHNLITEITSNLTAIATFIGERMDYYQSNSASPYKGWVY